MGILPMPTTKHGQDAHVTRNMKTRLQNHTLAALAFLLPNLLGFVLFTAGPVLFSLAASFTNWDLKRSVPLAFIGIENFRRLFHDAEFWTYLVNTFYLMLGMPFAIAGALLIALLLNQKVRGMTIYRTLFYLPSLTYGVALMILWKKLYNPQLGPINIAINKTLDVLRIPARAPDWLTSVNNIFGLAPEFDVPGRFVFLKNFFGLGARDALVIMAVWAFVAGNNMLLYLAALSNVPQELYDAADIDGAGRWSRFWHVTWPQLAPTTFFILIMSFITGLQGGFEQARIMTEGGPAGTTTTLSYYIYIKAFQESQMGYASAIAWLLFGMIFAITLINWRFGSRAFND